MTVREIAAQIDAKVEGNEELEIRAIAAMEQAAPDELTFASDLKRITRLAESKARVVIVPADIEIPAEVSDKTFLLFKEFDPLFHYLNIRYKINNNFLLALKFDLKQPQKSLYLIIFLYA